ncbi:MAG: DUF4145 domain-containing protein [Chloroflexi bacterium]|nr:DUF4145 domain-containing protein [Chloroflexota bacterium]
MKYVPPSVRETSFSCPHCDALAQQFWYVVRGQKPNEKDSLPLLFTEELAKEFIETIEDIQKREVERQQLGRLVRGIPQFENTGEYPFSQVIYNVFVSQCFNCDGICVWTHNKLVYPQRGTAPPANPDLSGEIRDDYNEASSILDLSPRGAAALLRLAIQKLCKELGQSGENINADIAALVAEGLGQQIQQALDVVRVIGNNAVHPGQIDLRDDRTTAHSLFTMINLIADRMISEPKRIEEAYATLPEDALEAIARRDDSSPQ